MRVSLAEKYPHLFCEVLWEWGPIRARFKQLHDELPGHLIANVNMVPRFGNDWVPKLNSDSQRVFFARWQREQNHNNAIQRVQRYMRRLLCDEI